MCVCVLCLSQRACGVERECKQTSRNNSAEEGKRGKSGSTALRIYCYCYCYRVSSERICGVFI